ESPVTIKASSAIRAQESRTRGGVVGVSLLRDPGVRPHGCATRGSSSFAISAPHSTTTQVGALVTVTGDGTYNPTATVLATLVGRSEERRVGKGDGLKSVAIDQGDNESLVTIKSSAAISTQASKRPGGLVGVAVLG